MEAVLSGRLAAVEAGTMREKGSMSRWRRRRRRSPPTFLSTPLLSSSPAPPLSPCPSPRSDGAARGCMKLRIVGRVGRPGPGAAPWSLPLPLPLRQPCRIGNTGVRPWPSASNCTADMYVSGGLQAPIPPGFASPLDRTRRLSPARAVGSSDKPTGTNGRCQSGGDLACFFEARLWTMAPVYASSSLVPPSLPPLFAHASSWTISATFVALALEASNS